jgi:hypothetical protein
LAVLLLFLLAFDFNTTQLLFFIFILFGRHIIFRFTETKEKKNNSNDTGYYSIRFFSSGYLLLGNGRNNPHVKNFTVTGTDPEISKKMGR